MSAEACPACGGGGVEDWGVCRPYSKYALQWLPEQGEAVPAGNLWRCKICGLGFRYPRASLEIIQAGYEAMPAGEWGYVFERNSAWTLANRLVPVLAGGADGFRVLDIGCYDGRFLERLPSSWEKHGVEPSVEAGERARSLGIHVSAGFLGDDCSWGETFDVVTAFDVFEHLFEPRKGMEQMLRFVRPGGCLILSTGNMDSWNWQLLGPRHWYLESPQHVCFGSRRFFEWFAAEAGVELMSAKAIPHQQASLWERMHGWAATRYFAWAGRRAAGPRIARRVLQTLPGCRQWRHATDSPNTPALKDHLFVVIAKGS